MNIFKYVWQIKPKFRKRMIISSNDSILIELILIVIGWKLDLSGYVMMI